MYGPLTIVGIQDIGPAGSREGEPVAYYWPVYIHMVRLIIPLALVVLLFRRPNRARGAWWVLPLPLIPLVTGLWIADAGDATNLFDFVGLLIETVTLPFFALAFLWLLADKLGNLPRLRTLTLAVGTLVLAGIIGLLGVSAFGFDAILNVKAFIYAVFVAVFLVAMSLAAFVSRKRYTPLRFLLWVFLILVVGTAVTGTALSMLLMLMAGILMGGGFSLLYLAPMLVSQMTVSALAGLVLFLFVLPFLVLALWCPFYRKRFYAILRLPGMQPEEDGVYNDLGIEVPMTEEDPPAGEPPETTDGL